MKILTRQPKRHPEFGYQTITGHYLNTFHVEALIEARDGRYDPDPTSRTDRELRAAALITTNGTITEAGLFHLRDLGLAS